MYWVTRAKVGSITRTHVKRCFLSNLGRLGLLRRESITLQIERCLRQLAATLGFSSLSIVKPCAWHRAAFVYKKPIDAASARRITYVRSISIPIPFLLLNSASLKLA